MKSKYLIPFIFTILFLSCDKEIKDPVSGCTLDAASINTNHPLGATLQSVLDNYCKRGLPGLSLAVETPGGGMWAGASGMARIEDETAMQPCHVHHSASIAKTYIATLVLKLAEDGKLNLDDPAKNYLPSEVYTHISNANIATIRQLLNHTSGIFNFDDNLKVYVDTFNDPLVNASSKTLFEKYVYDMPAYFPPGEGYHYSNTNYSLLGMIIENASGISLGEYMDQQIIQALNLGHTYYKASPDYPEISNLVNNYFEHFPKQIQNCTDIQKHFSNIAFGHEGILATPYDFGVFMKELISGNVLEETSLSEMINMNADESYGLGIMKYESDYETGYGHTGGSIGTMTYAIYFPDSDISFSVCCNLGAVFASDNTSMFYTDLYEELLGVILGGK